MRQTDEELPEDQSSAATCTLMILDDGRVLARNVTPALAHLLHKLYPDDGSLAARAGVLQGSQEPPLLSSSNQL